MEKSIQEFQKLYAQSPKDKEYGRIGKERFGVITNMFDKSIRQETQQIPHHFKESHRQEEVTFVKQQGKDLILVKFKYAPHTRELNGVGITTRIGGKVEYREYNWVQTWKRDYDRLPNGTMKLVNEVKRLNNKGGR